MNVINEEISDDEALILYDLAMAARTQQTQSLKSFAYGSTSLTANVPAQASSPRNHPFCPFPCCPGVFSHCGGKLDWIHQSWSHDEITSGRQNSGFFGCSNYNSISRCTYKYWPHEVTHHAAISTEIEASGATFKVVAAPGAEQAVAKEGGIKTIVSRLGLSFLPMPIGDGMQAVSFPLSEYDRFEQRAQFQKKNLLPRSGMIPQATLKSYRQVISMGEEQVEARLRKMPESLYDALLPFQREGVTFGIRRNARILIADEVMSTMIKQTPRQLTNSHSLIDGCGQDSPGNRSCVMLP